VGGGGCEELILVHSQPANSFIIVLLIRVCAQHGHPNMIIVKLKPVPSAINGDVDHGRNLRGAGQKPGKATRKKRFRVRRIGDGFFSNKEEEE